MNIILKLQSLSITPLYDMALRARELNNGQTVSFDSLPQGSHAMFRLEADKQSNQPIVRVNRDPLTLDELFGECQKRAVTPVLNYDPSFLKDSGMCSNDPETFSLLHRTSNRANLIGPDRHAVATYNMHALNTVKSLWTSASPTACVIYITPPRLLLDSVEARATNSNRMKDLSALAFSLSDKTETQQQAVALLPTARDYCRRIGITRCMGTVSAARM